MSKFDILVAGEINPDLILSGDVQPAFGQVEKLVNSATLTIGSSSAIFVCGAARLGLKMAFVGMCGDDVFGRFMLTEMQRYGVDVSNVALVPGGQTGLSVILNKSSNSGTGKSVKRPRHPYTSWPDRGAESEGHERRPSAPVAPLTCVQLFPPDRPATQLA